MKLFIVGSSSLLIYEKGISLWLILSYIYHVKSKRNTDE